MTVRTSLRRMPWVNLDHLHTTFLRFVGKKAVKLRKAPTMQTPFRLALFRDLRRRTNVGQILKHDGATRGGMLDNSLREDMITVPVESHRLTRQLFQIQ